MDNIKDTHTHVLDSGHSTVNQVPLNASSYSEDLPRHETCGNVRDLSSSEHHSDTLVWSGVKETCKRNIESNTTGGCLEIRKLAESPPNGIEQIETLVNSEFSESGTRPSHNTITNGKVSHFENVNDSSDSNMSSPNYHTDTESTAFHPDKGSTVSHPDEASIASHSNEAPTESRPNEASTSPTSSSSSLSSRKPSKLSKVDKQEGVLETNYKSNKKRRLETAKSELPSPIGGDDVDEDNNTSSTENSNGPKKGRKHPVTSGAGKKKQPSTTYQSEISPDQNGIKLFIKKSSPNSHVSKTEVKRKTKVQQKKIKRVKWADGCENEGSEDEEREQSEWGLRLPDTALHTIFLLLSYEEGCLPFLSRASRVCRLWYQAAIMPSLWHNVDLAGPWYKDKFKNVAKLRWLCENRLSRVQELNVGGWKMPAVQTALDAIAGNCPDLRGLNVMGWTGMSGEHMAFLVANCPALARLDLSSVCPQHINTKSVCSLASLTNLAQVLGERLTHLTLANNKLSGLPQIVTALATHCPNLQVLDLSNMTTQSVTTMPLHIEKLQKGCPKLRVLRITNSQLCLSQIPLKEQAEAPGFPLLEELSMAGIGVDGLCSNPVVDDSSIERILKSSHKLRLLDVRGCTRISDSSLVRVPAWDLEHLFVSGCYVTRERGNGLELIAQKWRHSLVEVDLSWSTGTEALDLAVCALAECDAESRLRSLNLCGSSVGLDPVRKVLTKCRQLVSLNLASCRALPRGIKRLYQGKEVDELRSSLDKRTETLRNDEKVAEVKS